jgi:hypothetical protein
MGTLWCDKAVGGLGGVLVEVGGRSNEKEKDQY